LQSAYLPLARGQECSRYTGIVVALLILMTLLSGCAVGPNYKRPAAVVPDTWKGEGPWQTAVPKDAIPKGNWWEIYHDSELDRLELELVQANQSLAAAQDRLSEARSTARVASSAWSSQGSDNTAGSSRNIPPACSR